MFEQHDYHGCLLIVRKCYSQLLLKVEDFFHRLMDIFFLKAFEVAAFRVDPLRYGQNLAG